MDPVLGDGSNPQRLNRYGYVLNDPVNYVDPDGADEVVWNSGSEVTVYGDTLDAPTAPQGSSLDGIPISSQYLSFERMLPQQPEFRVGMLDDMLLAVFRRSMGLIDFVVFNPKCGAMMLQVLDTLPTPGPLAPAGAPLDVLAFAASVGSGLADGGVSSQELRLASANLIVGLGLTTHSNLLGNAGYGVVGGSIGLAGLVPEMQMYDMAAQAQHHGSEFSLDGTQWLQLLSDTRNDPSAQLGVLIGGIIGRAGFGAFGNQILSECGASVGGGP